MHSFVPKAATPLHIYQRKRQKTRGSDSGTICQQDIILTQGPFFRRRRLSQHGTQCSTISIPLRDPQDRAVTSSRSTSGVETLLPIASPRLALGISSSFTFPYALSRSVAVSLQPDGLKVRLQLATPYVSLYFSISHCYRNRLHCFLGSMRIRIVRLWLRCSPTRSHLDSPEILARSVRGQMTLLAVAQRSITLVLHLSRTWTVEDDRLFRVLSLHPPIRVSNTWRQGA